jgi:hypothetical protein
MDRSEFSEVVQRFDRWRTVAKALGQQPYDAPAFEDERLYFRIDYAEQIAKWPRAREEGDWGAYIIDPTSGGMYCVVRSLWHERATHRSEAVEAVFSRAEDAGKYIIARVASSIRFDNGLTSQTVLWREQGLGAEINVGPVPESIIQMISERTPEGNVEAIREYEKMYSLAKDSNVFGVTSEGNSPYMHVLTLSFDELDAELKDGLPETSTS